MTGESGASPDLDAEGLLRSLPPNVDIDGLKAETVINVPSAHLSLGDQLDICRRARDTARRGIGVVVTHGTDTLEETAMLCDIPASGLSGVSTHRFFDFGCDLTNSEPPP